MNIALYHNLTSGGSKKVNSSIWRGYASRVLEHPLLIPFLCLLAILHQLARVLLFPDFNPDKMMQVAATMSMLDGQGLTVVFASGVDLSEPHRSFLGGYPPGYSILLAPLLALSQNVWLSALVVDCFAIVVFFVAWFVILEFFGDNMSLWAKVIIWAYWGLVYPPLLLLPSSDALALALYSAGLAAVMMVFQSRRRGLEWTVLSGFFVGASAAIRFAYWPLVIVIPVALAICAILFKRGLFKVMFIQALVALGIVGALQFYQYSVTNKINYLAEQTTGWFWEHLLSFYPFPASAMGIDLGWQTFLYDWMRNLLHLTDAWRDWGVWVLAGLVMLTFCAAVVSSLLASLDDKTNNAKINVSFFFLVGILSVLVTIALLSYLAVRYPGQFGGRWVYVNEKRYYGPVFGFLAVGLVYTLERLYRIRERRWGNWIVSIVAVFVLVVMLSVGLWRARDWKLRVADYLGGDNALFGRENQFVMDAVSRVRQVGAPVIYINNLPGSFYTVGAAAVSGAWIGALPDNGTVATTQPVTLILAVPNSADNPMDSRYAEFCARRQGSRLGAYKNYWLCEMTVSPDFNSN